MGVLPPIQEKMPNVESKNSLLDSFCLARQMSGRIWKEMREDFKQGLSDQEDTFETEIDFETLATHQDFKLFQSWKNIPTGHGYAHHRSL